MASHSDEEALDALLAVEPERPAHGRMGRTLRSVLGGISIIGLIGVAWHGLGGSSRPSVNQMQFEVKAEGEAALDPKEAVKRKEKRQQLVVEQDLRALLHSHVAKRGSSYKKQSGSDNGKSCLQQAEALFDQVVAALKLAEEMGSEELSAFKKRFASAMGLFCKDAIDAETWHDIAGSEFERQKPLVTSAMIASINKAGLGFTAKMHSWLVDETAGTFNGRLGMLPTPPGQKDIIKTKPTGRQADANLPLAFRAELKWPACKEAILRIHNQGHCGSCWAFGGLASIDARMCIAAGGKWDAPEDVLSRLHVTSCAPDVYYPGHDGCQGGFPHWPMEMMARTGVSSTSCLPYYISGEGVEHFDHTDVAPPCETHCQGGYSVPLANDTFYSGGIAAYNWLTQVHGDPEKIRITKVAILQEGPVAFAFKANREFMGYQSGVFSVCTGQERANHAVYTFGWGVLAAADGGDSIEYFEASNSWGANWGADGHFKIHPRCMTDVTIPGPIGSSAVNHQVGKVDLSVPRDENNPYWPWPAPAECPYFDGCVTDMEGDEPYANNEKCVSHQLDGKKITVQEFETERGYDVVKINGRAFSGKIGGGLDVDALSSMIVSEEGIKFESDFSLNGPGFKICEG